MTHKRVPHKRATGRAEGKKPGFCARGPVGVTDRAGEEDAPGLGRVRADVSGHLVAAFRSGGEQVGVGDRVGHDWRSRGLRPVEGVDRDRLRRPAPALEFGDEEGAATRFHLAAA